MRVRGKAFCLLISIVMMCIFLMSACNGNNSDPQTPGGNQSHTHTWSEEWSSDEDFHWHTCTECDEIDEKKAHTWDDGIVIKEAECGKEGSKEYTCKVCDRKKTEVIPAGDHIYEMESDGVYHWTACKECGYIQGKKSVHIWNEDNKCTECGYELAYTKGLEYEKVSDNFGGYYLSVVGIGSAKETDIVIPVYAEIDGEKLLVKTVAEDAFRGNQNITSVTFTSYRKGLDTISDGAFFECKKLKKVVFPFQLRRVGTAAFSDCTALESITFANKDQTIANGPIILENWSFKDCDSLTEIMLPAMMQSCESAFLGCDKLENVVFEDDPDSTRSTDISGAFQGCNALQSITLPERFTEIGEAAFKDCKRLSSVNLPDTIEIIGESAFQGCNSMYTFTIPASVTKIDSNAFSYCYNLVEVFNKSELDVVKGESTHGYVADNALNVYTPTEGKSQLTSTEDGFVFISDGVTAQLVIYTGTQTEITLPDSFVNPDGKEISSYSITENTFSFCTSVQAIHASQNNANYSSEDGVLYDKSGKVLVRVPAGKSGKYVMPDTILSMEYYALYYCANLENVVFGNGITAIEYDCFTGCGNIQSITLGSKVTDFNTYSLKDCKKLSEIIVPSDNNYYMAQNGALYDKKNSTLEFLPYVQTGVLIIPEGIKSLGSSGIKEHSEITSVVIPASVTNLGYGFYNCINLTSVKFEGTVEQWKAVRKTSVSGSPTWRKNAPFTEVVCSDGIVQY